MKPGAGIATLILGLVLTGRAEVAGPGAEGEATSRAMKQRLTIRLKEQGVTYTPPAEPPPLEARESEASPPPGDLLVLEPFRVEAKKLPPPPPRETRLQEFFRTGTVWEDVGPRVTKRLWIRGDKGVMFSFLW